MIIEMKPFKKQKSYSEEFDFFIHNPLNSYEGKYVAIVGNKVVSAGSSAKETWDKARKKFPNFLPTIAKIPKKEVMVLVWK